MKKLLTFSIVIALVCTTAFAEVNVTAGAGMSFIPLGVRLPDGGDAEAVAGFGRNGGNATEIQVNVEGKTESGKAGFLFQWRPKINGGDISANEIGDNAGIWYKPLDIVRIDAGRFVNNDIRGKVGNGAWFGDYTISRAGESQIFKNFDAKAAAMLSATPIEGLSVYALVNSMASTYVKVNNTWEASKGAEFVWENTQVAVAYALPNIGLVRAQYIGAHPLATFTAYNNGLASIDVTNSKFELAFAYTGLEGLTLDVGGGIFLPFEDITAAPGAITQPSVTVTNPPTPASGTAANSIAAMDGKWMPGATAGLGVKYAADPLTVNFIVDGLFAQSAENEVTPGVDRKIEFGFRLRPYLAVTYKLNDTFTAQVEGGVDFYGDTKFETGGQSFTQKGGLNYGFGAGLQTTLAPSCTIKVGVTYAGGEVRTNFPAPMVSAADIDAAKLTGVFSVPVIFSVSF